MRSGLWFYVYFNLAIHVGSYFFFHFVVDCRREFLTGVLFDILDLF